MKPKSCAVNGPEKAVRTKGLRKIRAAALAAACGLSLMGSVPAMASTSGAVLPAGGLTAGAASSETLTAGAASAAGTSEALPSETLPAASVTTEAVVRTKEAAESAGTLNLTVFAKDSYTEKETPEPGAEIMVTQIASLDRETQTYTMLDEYAAIEDQYRQSQEVDETANIFDGMTTEQSNALALLFTDVTDGETGITDAEGRVSFSLSEEGMYLVRQTGQVKGFTPLVPFMVCVPKGESDGSWTSVVDAYPKTVPETETETQTETTPPPTETTPQTTPPTNPSTTPGTQLSTNPAKTGDENPIGNYVGLALISGIMIIGIVSSRRKEKD